MVQFDNYFTSVVLVFGLVWIMSPSASDRVYSLQMSESWTLFHFWFGFIREAFIYIFGLSNNLLLLSLFTHHIAVTVSFWRQFWHFMLFAFISDIEITIKWDQFKNSVLIQILHRAQCVIFRYWNQSNWNQLFIKIWAFARKLVFCNQAQLYSVVYLRQ